MPPLALADGAFFDAVPAAFVAAMYGAVPSLAGHRLGRSGWGSSVQGGPRREPWLHITRLGACRITLALRGY
ncbi:hypothetical protein CENSYa_0753 [Cenarchaeum symbiosum A]|uniref:Uncharacterized protein n=1 Tax=Cenarchaeum symbiosum (strain A) TaxID=414004 RepID=A0RVL9_CENSY|nr:hypothetical protein CENSYa_0753 [Cenarchaeum symbiosum A]